MRLLWHWLRLVLHNSRTMARRGSAVAANGVSDMSDLLYGNWQPIETAPKDGREVLLRVELRAGIPGKCLVGHYMGGGHCIEDHPPIDAGWYFWNGCMFDNRAKPIEWMPIPE